MNHEETKRYLVISLDIVQLSMYPVWYNVYLSWEMDTFFSFVEEISGLAYDYI